MIIKNEDDFGVILNCAVRYAIGRRTYIPVLVADFITPLIPKLDKRTLGTLERDIREAENYGDKLIDEPVWMNLLQKVQDDLKKR